MASRKDVEARVRTVLADRGNYAGLRLVFDVLLIEFVGDEDSVGKHFRKLVDRALKGDGDFCIAEHAGRTLLCTKDSLGKEAAVPTSPQSVLTAAASHGAVATPGSIDPLVQEIVEMLTEILEEEPTHCLSTRQGRLRVLVAYFDLHPGTRTNAKRDAVIGAYYRIIAWAYESPPRVPFTIHNINHEDHVCLNGA